MGRGGCYEREGRRSWRLLGHACVATLLLVNAVANSIRLSNCTATDFVNNTPRGCGLVLRHLLCQLPSISHHSFWSPRSCLRPSRSAAAPELPVLEVAGQHRICMSVAPTGSPGEREDAHTCALAHINSFSEQRVNRSANGLTVNSTRQTFPGSPKFSRLLNIGHGIFHRGRCSLTCPRCWHTPTAISTRGVTRVSAVDSPRLKRPPLALDAHDTDGWCYATSLSTYDAPCTSARRESGRTGEPVQPAPCHMHSARGGLLPCWGAGHHESKHPATVPDAACKILCIALHTSDHHRSYWSSYTAPKSEPLLRPAACVRAATEGGRGYLPQRFLLHWDRHAQPSILHCTPFCTGCRQWLGSWAPTATSKYSKLGALHTTLPRPAYGGFTALHKRTTATPKHGSTSGSPHCCCRITSG